MTDAYNSLVLFESSAQVNKTSGWLIYDDFIYFFLVFFFKYFCLIFMLVKLLCQMVKEMTLLLVFISTQSDFKTIS